MASETVEASVTVQTVEPLDFSNDETATLGSYPQPGSDPEPIEWYVLAEHDASGPHLPFHTERGLPVKYEKAS